MSETASVKSDVTSQGVERAAIKNKPTRALIVDDSPTDGYVASKIAKELFDEVVVVTNDKDLMRVLPAFRPDVIFMDQLLGWSHGLSLTQEIRHRNDDLSTTPICVVSSKDTDSDIEWAKKQGAGAYIVKPATLEKMEIAARGLLIGWSPPASAEGKPAHEGRVVTAEYL
jgi:CheY-like chemotaxis protein